MIIEPGKTYGNGVVDFIPLKLGERKHITHNDVAISLQRDELAARYGNTPWRFALSAYCTHMDEITVRC